MKITAISTKALEYITSLIDDLQDKKEGEVIRRVIQKKALETSPHKYGDSGPEPQIIELVVSKIRYNRLGRTQERKTLMFKGVVFSSDEILFLE